MASWFRPLLLAALVFSVAFAMLLGRPHPALGRDLAVPLDALVHAELVGVGPMPGHALAVVLLRADDTEEPVAIFVGIAEAAAILRARDDIRPPRPLTHELGVDLLDASGAQVQRMVIDELRDGAYLAALEIRLRDRRAAVWIDARPSDALALALRHDAPILLAPEVIAAGTDHEGRQEAPGAQLTADRPGLLQL